MVKLTDPEESKEHIAQYFEQLHKAREATEVNMEETRKINLTVKQLSGKREYNTEQENIKKEELEQAIQKLKKGKSCGPDNIPNESLIEADEENREIYREIYNQIMEEQKIPPIWQMGIITRIYKGKGIKGKCSNERGITCASNMGKAMERILNNRAKKK